MESDSSVQKLAYVSTTLSSIFSSLTSYRNANVAKQNGSLIISRASLFLSQTRPFFHFQLKTQRCVFIPDLRAFVSKVAAAIKHQSCLHGVSLLKQLCSSRSGCYLDNTNMCVL